MSRLKRFFLSRKTVLVLILFALGAVVIAYIFPQKFSQSPAEIEQWHQRHPSWIPWIDRFGLDHVYSTPWFAALLFAFLLTLIISSFEQTRILVRRMTGAGTLSGISVSLNAPEGEIISTVRKYGYFRIYGNSDEVRFVKHPWGYAGNVLLHLGIVITILSSLLMVLTQKRGLLRLVEGEISVPGSPWLAEEKGMLAGNFVLPGAVGLNTVVPEFWETDDLKQLTTGISFVDPVGAIQTRVLAINQTLHYKGVKVYQAQEFGNTFFVEFVDMRGRTNGLILSIQNPSRRDKPGYGNFQAEWSPYLLKAKYFADAERRTMSSEDPLLVLRLVDGGNIIGETSLGKGETGKLGPYTVKLVRVSRWAGIIFADTTGMPGIFAGFFIIIIGGCLFYFVPPRELYLKKEGSVASLTWGTSRFGSFYKEEFDKIISALGNIKSHE